MHLVFTCKDRRRTAENEPEVEVSRITGSSILLLPTLSPATEEAAAAAAAAAESQGRPLPATRVRVRVAAVLAEAAPVLVVHAYFRSVPKGIFRIFFAKMCQSPILCLV